MKRPVTREAALRLGKRDKRITTLVTTFLDWFIYNPLMILNQLLMVMLAFVAALIMGTFYFFYQYTYAFQEYNSWWLLTRESFYSFVAPFLGD